MPWESGDRFVCIKDDPWTPDKANGPVLHPDAVSDGPDVDYGMGCNTARYQCPWCGKAFEQELDQ